MRGFAQVFLLEMRLRKAVFPAALVAGIIAFPMAMIMTRTFDFAEALNAGAFSFALIGGELLALYLGATVLCQDLSEGRHGFYFARPVSGWALWAGKFSAAWIVVLGAMLVTVLPATLFGEGLASIEPIDNPFWVFDFGPQSLSPLWHLAIVSLGALLFMAHAHALSVMFRARSPWLILDAVMVVLVPTMAWWGVKRLVSWETQFVLAILLSVWLASSLLALLSAGAFQTVLGRCDLRRGHKVLSLTLWSIVSVAVCGGSLFAYRTTHLSPKDLAQVEIVRAASQGPWAIIGGEAKGLNRHAWASFLLNTDTGVWARVPAGRWAGGQWISPDGKIALAIDTAEGYDGTFQLVSYDLAQPGSPVPQTHGLLVQGRNVFVAFSTDSSRFAMLADQDLTVYDLSSWNLVAAQKMPLDQAKWSSWRLSFADLDHLRLYGNQSGLRNEPLGLTVFEFDVADRKLVATGRIEDAQTWRLRQDMTGDRILLSTRFGHILLCDAKTAHVIKDFGEGTGKARGAFLSDGRPMIIERGERDTEVRVYSTEGEPLRTASLGIARSALQGLEPLPGKVLIATWQPKTSISVTGDVRLLDLTSGAFQVLPGLRPASFYWWYFNEPVSGKTLSRANLFLNDKGKLIRYDFATGKSEIVKIAE